MVLLHPRDSKVTDYDSATREAFPYCRHAADGRVGQCNVESGFYILMNVANSLIRGETAVAKNVKGLVDPTKLKPVDKREGILQVIVETPKGSQNKFAFDPDQALFALKKVLPAGNSLPL